MAVVMGPVLTYTLLVGSMAALLADRWLVGRGNFLAASIAYCAYVALFGGAALAHPHPGPDAISLTILGLCAAIAVARLLLTWRMT